MTPDCWTLLPVHGFATGKSRLAAVLDARARVALNRHLLMQTLEVIEAWRGDLAQCIVVSPCDDALACARAAGAQALREPAGAGLNAALEFAATKAAARSGGKLVVVACDLPYLSVEALNALTDQATATRGAALAPDRAGSGTNALVLSTGVHDVFRFGADSCAQHRVALADAGSRCVVYARAELAFDLDTPQDYAEWTAQRDARIPRGISPPAQHQLEEAGK